MSLEIFQDYSKLFISTYFAPWIFFHVLSIHRPRDLHWFSTLNSSTETGNVSFRCDDRYRSLRELWRQFRCTLVICAFECTNEQINNNLKFYGL